MNIAVAIRNRHLLSFHYRGAVFTVKPHTYGVDAHGRFVLRASELNGRWRLFQTDEMRDIVLLPTRFRGVHHLHRVDDRYFKDVIAQLS